MKWHRNEILKLTSREMKAEVIKSIHVCKSNDIFLLHIGFKHYDLGFQVHEWGLRLMLIWWHVCFYSQVPTSKNQGK
jgi:hypothetical protein